VLGLAGPHIAPELVPGRLFRRVDLAVLVEVEAGQGFLVLLLLGRCDLGIHLGLGLQHLHGLLIPPATAARFGRIGKYTQQPQARQRQRAACQQTPCPRFPIKRHGWISEKVPSKSVLR
jgi:hypothetical protein